MQQKAKKRQVEETDEGKSDDEEKNKMKIRKSCEWRNKKAKKYLNHRQYEELYKNNYWFKWKAVKIETSD